MYLRLADLPLPENLIINSFIPDPPDDDSWGEGPGNLIPLGETSWPIDVVNKIVSFYLAIGLVEPMRQKLVEPYAIGFGGMKNGSLDLTGVDWEMVVDYFQWESLVHSKRHFEATTMRDKCAEKYGIGLSHYSAYPIS